MIDFTVEDMVDLPRDVVPDTIDVEYPCEVCGRESGPYAGRGRKPKRCPDHKPTRKNSGQGSPKVTGSSAVLAAQATEVLSQLNGFIALGTAALKMFSTSGAIAEYDETFKQQAYSALVTDPELCKFILRGGVKSAKLTLLMAYGGMAVAAGPTALQEIKALQAERKAARETAE